MAYNKFRWWTKGRAKKPLSANAPLLLKIRNGDYNYSYMFAEATEMRNTATKSYEQTNNNYGGTDERNRVEASMEAGRMKRVKALKLELEAWRAEEKILWSLRKELEKEFEKDLWDKAMERQRGKGTLEDLYEWYRKNSKVKNPQSIQDIQLRKPNTKGFEYLF